MMPLSFRDISTSPREALIYQIRHILNPLRLRAFLHRYLPKKVALKIAVMYSVAVNPLIKTAEAIIKKGG